MIPNVLADVVDLLHRLSDRSRFEPFHRGVQSAYRGPLLKTLEKAARSLGEVRLEARNSTTENRGFNAFVSDLDLAVVFRHEPEVAEVRRLQRFFAVLRRAFPFVGEAEFYTEHEWTQRRAALDEAAPVVELFWKLRKMAWIENDPRRNASRYHRRKAELGIRRCLDALGESSASVRPKENWRLLGVGFHRFLEGLWQSLELPPVEASAVRESLTVQCGYLELVLTSDPLALDTLYVPGATLVPLLALLPPSQRWVGTTEAVVERYRAHPRASELREALARWEWCVAQSCARTHPAPGHEEWRRRLFALISPDRPGKRRQDFAARLRETSPTLCLAAWKQSTVNLHRGMTHSCCLAPPHPIDVEAVQQSPTALHNTERKKETRAALLAGGRPDDCSYCWEIEQSAKEPTASDRYDKSNQPWALETFDDVLKEGARAETQPSYLEVSFSHRCNLKCSYCNMSVSSRWQQEVEQHGPYLLRGGAPYMKLEYMRQTGHRVEPDGAANPFVDAFWKWWPELVESLRVFRITGGEPLLHPDTFRVLSYLRQHSQPRLELAVNSNLSVPAALVRGFLDQVRAMLDASAVRSFTLYTSADTYGAQAEYLRHGMRYALFRENVTEALKAHPQIKVVVMCTFNALSVPGFTQFADDILDLRRAHCPEAGDRLLLDVNRLRNPTWQAIETLDEHWRSEFRRVIGSLRARSRRVPELAQIGFTDHEIRKVERLVELLDAEPASERELDAERANFYRFFREHDRRRGTRFEEAFPEMKAFWERCRRTAEEEDASAQDTLPAGQFPSLPTQANVPLAQE